MRPGHFLLLGAVAAGLAAAAPGTAIRLVDRATESGVAIRTTNGNPERRYIIETIGSGAALLDYDLDGDLDLYIVNGSRLEAMPQGEQPIAALYRNDGGGRFTDITTGSGLAIPFWGFGAAVGDYDNDGDPDLLVTAFGPDRLFRNNGDGTFTERGAAAGLDSNRWGASAAFFDADQDGLLDIYITNYITFDAASIPPKGDPNSPCRFRNLTVMCGPNGLPGAVDHFYHNNGDATFTDIAAEAGLFTDGKYYGLGVTTVDVDGDGRQDILVANDSTPNHYYRNLGGLKFEDEAMMSGFAYSGDGREQAGMGIDTGDVDANGTMDIFITNFSHDYATLRLNDGAGMLEDSSVRLGLAEPTIRTLGWGTVMVDLENDGDLDLFLANGHVYPEVDDADIGTSYLQPNQIFEQTAPLVFREVTAAQVPALGVRSRHRGLAAGDLNGDGKIDLTVTIMDGQPELLMNESAGGSWIGLRLVGRASNRDAVGARVELRAGERVWVLERRGGGSYLSASSPVLLAGLGTVKALDSVAIRWPSGERQSLGALAPGSVHTVVEPAGAGNPAAAAPAHH